jgi:1-acyl-sn-glycerol-3-phosphate acyltransferase
VTPKKEIAVVPGTIRIALGDPVSPRLCANKEALLVEVRRRLIEQHRAIGGGGGDLADPFAPPAPEAQGEGEGVRLV